MKNTTLIAIVVSLVIGGIAYLCSNNYYVAGGLTLVYLLYYLVIAMKKIKKYLANNERIHHCYHFVNSFIITMSVKGSLDDAYNNAIQGASGEFSDIVSELENMAVMERLEYLRQYFNLAVYKMFINVINIYQEQGGNLLSMGENLIQETTRIEETLNKSNSSIKKILVEFFVLWIISFGVLIFLRFGIPDFYETMLKSLPFFISLIVFFVLFLFSLHVFLTRATKLYIKEDKFDV